MALVKITLCLCRLCLESTFLWQQSKCGQEISQEETANVRKCLGRMPAIRLCFMSWCPLASEQNEPFLQNRNM